jgi:hypothetical protein
MTVTKACALMKSYICQTNTNALYSRGPRFKSYCEDQLLDLGFCGFSQSLQANTGTVP